MRVYDHWQIPEEARGASIAMGNFDGVHLGHQSVIDLARREGAPLGVLTFEPHPREFFRPDDPPFRLMNAEARRNRLEKLGVDFLYALPFDVALASMEPETFAREVLSEALGVTNVTVGRDFRFGRKRAGGIEELKACGQTFGFDVTVAPLLEVEGVHVSSTAIRNALSEGQPELAAAMLGHLHRIEGAVIHGEKRGRELGYPTANMSVDGLHLPKLGVYAVKVDVMTGPQKGSYMGAASLGVRPMFGVNTPNLETNLLDFKGDLYGQHLSIALVEYLRPEVAFTGIPDLIKQMDQDVIRTREILTA
ncbi:bifunctional riboflavin kinase/FAD synthetase [Thioclava sp. GXIMD2076]|uniref:bifunctional riboflavin kinase/FAD synthetase n=1 Tax=Thioclava sp. GXIMD2076 TaxID=3131931 RepID=UPI0030CCD2D9